MSYFAATSSNGWLTVSWTEVHRTMFFFQYLSENKGKMHVTMAHEIS